MPKMRPELREYYRNIAAPVETIPDRLTHAQIRGAAN
jgi:hypothetical protein